MSVLSDPVQTYDLYAGLMHTAYGDYSIFQLQSNESDGFAGQANSSIVANEFDTWTCLMVSGDANQSSGNHAVQIALGDTLQTVLFSQDATEAAIGNPVFQSGPLQLNARFDGTPFWFGSDAYPGDAIVGDVADFRIYVGKIIDFSLEANRRLFIDANGKPVDPAVARAALGPAMVEFIGDKDSFDGNANGAGGVPLESKNKIWSTPVLADKSDALVC
jgi:hypothetical protein